MTSAAFTINGTQAPAAVSVAYGATVTFAATDLTGAQGPIEWTITGSSKSTYTNPTITAGGIPTGSTATCPQIADPGGGLGASFVVQCTVRDSLNNVYTQTGVFGTYNSAGIIPLAVGEGAARSSTHGWVEAVNEALASGGTFNVMNFGAKALDGMGFDDTTSIQAAIDAVIAAGRGTVYFPAGRYYVTAPLVTASNIKISFVGDGRCSQIGWAFDGNLFSFPVAMDSVRFEKLYVYGGPGKSATSWAIKFAVGVAQSNFDSFHMANVYEGSGIDLGVADTDTLHDCILSVTAAATGLRVCAGSEVRMIGGRICGPVNPPLGTSIGVDITGNQGGFHLVGTDVIGHGTGLRSWNGTGSGSNREIFIDQATFDACCVSIDVFDEPYIACDGVWSSGSGDVGVYLRGAGHIIWNGGTIRYGGKYGGSSGIGAYITSGRALFSGTQFGWCTGTDGTAILGVTGAEAISVVGCQITDNIKAANVAACTHYCFVGNFIDANATGATRGATGADQVWEYNAGSG
jgi:hypothetical protein